MAVVERPINTPISERKSGINKKLAAVLLTGSLALGGGLAIYGGNQNKDDSPQPSPIIGGIGNENKTPNPTENIAAPTPEQQQNTERQQAIKSAIDTWITTLNSGEQTRTVDGALYNLHITETLSVNARNIEEWESQIPDLINGDKTSSPLEVEWHGGVYTYDDNTPNQSIGSKTTGEIEINNATVDNIQEHELTDADKANGISWHGYIRVSYIERYRSNFYGGTDYGDYEKVSNWVKSPEKNSFPDFSSWEEAHIDIEVSKVNNDWSTLILNNQRRGTIFNGMDMFEGYIMPADFFDNYNCDAPTSFCKSERISLPK